MQKIVEQDEFGDEFNMDLMMKNLNIADKVSSGASVIGGNNTFSSYFDYVQNQTKNNSQQFNASNYNNYSKFQSNDFYDGQMPNNQIGNDISNYYNQQNQGINIGKQNEGFDYNYYSGSDGFNQFANGYPQIGMSGKPGMMNNMSAGNNGFNQINYNPQNMNMNSNFIRNNNYNNLINNHPNKNKGNYYQKNMNNYNNITNENSFYQNDQFINPQQQMNNLGGMTNSFNNMNNFNTNQNSYNMGNNFNNGPFINKNNNFNYNNNANNNMNKSAAKNPHAMTMQNYNNAGGMMSMNNIIITPGV